MGLRIKMILCDLEGAQIIVELQESKKEGTLRDNISNYAFRLLYLVSGVPIFRHYMSSMILSPMKLQHNL